MTADSETKISRFNPETIRPGKVVINIGRRGSGKSFLLLDQIWHIKKKVSSAIIVSGTEESNGMFSQVVPKLFIHTTVQHGADARVIDRRRERARIGKAEPCLVILDDVFYDNSIGKCPALRQCFLNGRHYGISLYIALQYAPVDPPVARGQHGLCLHHGRAYHKGQAHPLRLFLWVRAKIPRLLHDSGRLHGGIQVHSAQQYSQLGKVSDRVSWYRASPRGRFTIGSYQFWRYGLKYAKHASRGGRGEQEGEEEDDGEDVDAESDVLVFK